MPNKPYLAIFHTMLMAMNRTVCLTGCIFISDVQLKDDKISFQMREGIGGCKLNSAKSCILS